MDKDLIRLIITLIITILSGLGIGLSRLNEEIQKSYKRRLHDKEMARQLKLIALRGEYLGIFNSDVLTVEEKYDMTRAIFEEYKSLGGNHYMDELDTRLFILYAKTIKSKVRKENSK